MSAVITLIALWEALHLQLADDARGCFNPWCFKPIESELKKCSKCHAARYCQKKAWIIHKLTCGKTGEEI